MSLRHVVRGAGGHYQHLARALHLGRVEQELQLHALSARVQGRPRVEDTQHRVRAAAGERQQRAGTRHAESHLSRAVVVWDRVRLHGRRAHAAVSAGRRRLQPAARLPRRLLLCAGDVLDGRVRRHQPDPMGVADHDRVFHCCDLRGRPVPGRAARGGHPGAIQLPGPLPPLGEDRPHARGHHGVRDGQQPSQLPPRTLPSRPR
mmetsp:Transcript_2121/g.6911  ORF Transcript_2121/g.6911 Transcript_2121/m.6911 type:complete len:204 (-) Transcript_2121:737-1348(-)